MQYEVTVGETEWIIDVESGAEGLRVRVNRGDWKAVDLRQPMPDILSFLLEGQSHEASLVSRKGGQWEVDLRGVRHTVQVVDPRKKALSGGRGVASGSVIASMPGRIIRVLVGAGEAVKKGQPVLVMEAMKMENEIKAPADGVVGSVPVSPGQTIESGAVLMVMQ